MNTPWGGGRQALDDLPVRLAGARRRRAARWRPPRRRYRRVGRHHHLDASRLCRLRVGGHRSAVAGCDGGRTCRGALNATEAARRYALAVSRRMPVAASSFLSNQPNRPSDSSCCFCSSLKTFPALGFLPCAFVNVSAPYISWPVFRYPSLAGCGCLPRQQVVRAAISAIACPWPSPTNPTHRQAHHGAPPGSDRRRRDRGRRDTRVPTASRPPRRRRRASHRPSPCANDALDRPNGDPESTALLF